ncbi:MAG: hypothetical protein NZ455_00670 [Bacteroidia bacterium]|nr:hypothetical protein [Bacteroidia bacterium]MDW8345419.1 hypothetical protein [Bacteroidia bacterium]
MGLFRKFFGRVPSLRSGRATTHYADASVLRCASHCLTACSVSLTQAAFGCFTLFSYACLLYLV